MKNNFKKQNTMKKREKFFWGLGGMIIGAAAGVAGHKWNKEIAKFFGSAWTTMKGWFKKSEQEGDSPEGEGGEGDE